MKQIYILLLFFITSCDQQSKADDWAHESKTDSVKLIESPVHLQIKAFGEETDFETKDTISTRGPHSITCNILQDKNGNIWFATWQGIIRYDGTHFINMTLKEGLGHYHVFSILEDHTGNLWFGTIGGGVYRYDPSNTHGTSIGTFTHLTSDDGLAGNKVMCMLEDRSGNIWFGTKENGLSCYNGRTFTSFTMNDGLPHNDVYSMMLDKKGKLWIGTEGGICSMFPGTSGNYSVRFTKEDLPFRHVLSLVNDRKENIWIGSQAGLHRYNGIKVEMISTNFTPGMFEDRSGNLWLSTTELNKPDMVLFCYNGTFTKIKSDKQIFGVTEDHNGNIWFGTANGVGRYDPSSPKAVIKRF